MSDIRSWAVQTIETEAQAVADLVGQLTDDFDGAVRAMEQCRGKVIVTGMGKSGIIGAKIAATLASTGTPAFFLHPGEAYHGDLGMISRGDVVLALSNSGQTDELLKLMPFLKQQSNVVIAMTGLADSTLARHSTFHLNVAVAQEACPLKLAPTSSTTAALVMGDALAVALMNLRGFKAEDFARFHPGGSLGRRLLTTVGDVCRRDNLPIVPPTMKLGEVIIAISDARLGLAAIVVGEKIAGVVTDGDVRRAMLRYKSAFFDLAVSEIMSVNPKVVRESDQVLDAEKLMHKHKIHSLPVVDSEDKLVGIVELYDLV